MDKINPILQAIRQHLEKIYGEISLHYDYHYCDHKFEKINVIKFISQDINKSINMQLHQNIIAYTIIDEKSATYKEINISDPELINKIIEDLNEPNTHKQ